MKQEIYVAVEGLSLLQMESLKTEMKHLQFHRLGVCLPLQHDCSGGGNNLVEFHVCVRCNYLFPTLPLSHH